MTAPVDLDALERLRLAAKHCTFTCDKWDANQEAIDYVSAAVNALPALIAELRAARECLRVIDAMRRQSPGQGISGWWKHYDAERNRYDAAIAKGAQT